MITEQMIEAALLAFGKSPAPDSPSLVYAAMRAALEAATALSQAEGSSPVAHASDCAVHNAPAYPTGPCDCGALPTRPREQEGAEPVALVQTVYDTFKRDMEQGYKTKDKEFAVDLLGKALAAFRAHPLPAASKTGDTNGIS